MTAVRCRACGADRVRPFYAATGIPVQSCLMVDDREAALAFPKGDLELGFCPECGFIQNNRFDPALVDYSPAYEETQAFSARFMRFVDEIVDDQQRKHDLAGKTVLEIGCGKGEFLVRLVERTGAFGIGFDPAYRPERTVSPAADRLRFVQGFYGPDQAGLEVDHVCCRHTLEHIPDVADFIRLIRRNLGDRRAVPLLFELPDVERVLLECAFWDIYYEHCSYFTPGSLARLFRHGGFAVDALWKAYDDQYLMLEARPDGGVAGAAVAPLPLEDEPAHTARQVDRFAQAVSAKLALLKSEVEAWRAAGKTVTVWSSSSKAVAYLSMLGLGDEIAAVTDINPYKAGKFLAGTGHAISLPERLREVRPDVVVVMNPIYVEEIRSDLARLGLAPELRPLS